MGEKGEEEKGKGEALTDGKDWKTKAQDEGARNRKRNTPSKRGGEGARGATRRRSRRRRSD